MDTAFKKAVEVTLKKLKRMDSPCITNGIDMLGLVIITNYSSVSKESIEYCFTSQKLFVFCWYLSLILAINNDVSEIIRCLIAMEPIPCTTNIPPEFFRKLGRIDLDTIIEHIKPNWENTKFSLRIPIRIANNSDTVKNLAQYLEWMLPKHGISKWCVIHQCIHTQPNTCESIPFVNWSSLKVVKFPPKVLEIPPFPDVGKLNLSNNLLKRVPSQLIQFKSMQNLNLSYNNISFSIPCQLLALDSLKRLDLSHNEISHFLSNKNGGTLLCQSLDKLFLSHNNLSQIPNCFSIPSLSIIDLSNNKLKSFPIFLSNSPLLLELKLKKNDDLKSLPGFLGDFDHLKNIEIDLRNFSPSLSVNTAQDIKKCLKGGRCIKAFKVFCIGESEQCRLNFIKKLMDEKDLPNDDGKKPMNSILWGNITIWNLRNNNIEVTSRVFKKLSEIRSVVYLVIDFTKGIGDNLKRWVEEILKIKHCWRKYNWISCVSVVAFNSLERTNGNGKIEICKHHFPLYTEHQIRQLRDDLFNNKYKVTVASRMNRAEETIEKEMISSDYNQIYRTYINLLTKQRLLETCNPVVNQSTFINFFVNEMAYNTVKLLESTNHIGELLKLLEKFGLIVYLDEMRDTPIVLKPFALYNTLIQIVTEEVPYLQFGLLSMQKFDTHIQKKPYSILFHDAYSYMLLLRKLDLIMVMSKQYFIVPSKLPILKEEINIEHEFRPSWSSISSNKDGIEYNHRVFLLKNMAEGYCNELIADILYETPIVSTIVSNKPMEQPNDLFFDQNPPENDPMIYSGIEPARSRAQSTNELELVSYDNNRTVSIWNNTFLYVDTHNAIKLLVREYSAGKGIEIVTARDPLKMGDTFIFRVKSSIYSSYHDPHSADLLAIPQKQLRDEKNPNQIDSLYKFANLQQNTICYVSPNCISEEVLLKLAPELSIDHSYTGIKFREMPYEPNNVNSKLGSKMSCVYRGKFQNEQVAVKEFKLNSHNSKLRLRHEMLKEAKLLSEYRHSCLINLIGVSSTSLSRCFIVLKLAPFGELGSFLVKNNPLKPRILYLRFTQQIAAGMDFLHTHMKDIPLIHHDLKPENILVISDEVEAYINVKIADLNMSNHRAGFDGTPGYRAPEIISHHAMVTYDYKIDVFSFAIVLVNLISHKIPFKEMLHADTALTAKNFRPDIDWSGYFEKGIVSLLPIIHACWNRQPQDRPDMKSVLTAVSSPSLQLMYSNRSLPNNSSYNPMESCAVRVQENKEILCYAFSTTYEGSTLYTKICLYDVANNQITERPYKEFYKHKELMQMCSHENTVVITLKDYESRCYMAQYSINIGSEMTEVATSRLPEDIFHVQAMCIDAYNIYIALGKSVYVFKIDTHVLERSFNELENDIQCMLSLGNELWISSQLSDVENPSIKIKILDKENLRQLFAIKEQTDTPRCIVQMVPTNHKKNHAHQTEQQVWCLDAVRPKVHIFNSSENKYSVGTMDLNDYLPCDAKYSQEEHKKYRFKNTKMCASTNTIWISTQHGYILIFSISKNTQESIMSLHVFIGPIVFMTPLEIGRGSMVACCGQVSDISKDNYRVWKELVYIWGCIYS